MCIYACWLYHIPLLETNNMYPFFIFKKTSVLVSYIVENVFLSIANKSPPLFFKKKQTNKKADK